MGRIKNGDKTNTKRISKRNPEYYKIKYPNASNEECERLATLFKKSSNWQSIEYYINKYPDKSLEECEKLRKDAISKKNENHPSHIEYYRKKFPNASEDELRNMVETYTRENNFQSILYYRKRFPNASEDELQEMVRLAKKSYLEKRPDNSGANNPGHKSNTTLNERRERSPKCIEFYNKRYPELSESERYDMLYKHLNSVRDILSDKSRQVKCVEYWIKLGYSVDEANEIISKSQSTFTLEKCIAKYGEIEGQKRFAERQKKWTNSLSAHFVKYGDGRSSQSSFAATIIDKICEEMNIERPSKEKYLSDSDGNHYAYDFCLNNKIIEFNGDYWHCNPKFFKHDDINPTKKMTAESIWMYDAKKIKCAKDNGYEVIVIWEDDKEHEDVIKKCIDFLYG